MSDTFKKKVGFISLGCDKNRVDLEKVISRLSTYSCFEFVSNKEDAEIIIINTCAFLLDARNESFSLIKEMSYLKEMRLEKLIVMGCLPMLEKDKTAQDYPLIDALIVPSEYDKIDEIIFKLYKAQKPSSNDSPHRMLTTPLHYAYLKIADGCNNRCAFCKIPFIRGSYKSEDMSALLKEAQALANSGVKEIILVAQDITKYGCDNNYKENLVTLLKNLSKIKKLSWIRLLYCYPDMVTDELIEEIKTNPKVLHYLDIPLQHISNSVLQNMHRISRKEDIISLISKLRTEIPDIVIRSTFMVGFPGETKHDFNELLSFLNEYQLDNVGFFKYSREEGTASYDMPNQVTEKEKDKRLKKVQQLQEKISNAKNTSMFGKTFKVIVDSFDSQHKFYVGRTYGMAPDVDFEVLFSCPYNIKLGAFVDVDILDYDKGYFIGQVDRRTTY